MNYISWNWGNIRADVYSKRQYNILILSELNYSISFNWISISNKVDSSGNQLKNSRIERVKEKSLKKENNVALTKKLLNTLSRLIKKILEKLTIIQILVLS